MTGSELQKRVYSRLDDDPNAPAGVTPAEILQAINEGQELAALLTLCFETTKPITITAATPFFGLRSLFPDFLLPLALRVNGRRILPATIADIDALNESWQASPGTLDRYVLLGFNLLAVTKQPIGDTPGALTYACAPAPVVLNRPLDLDEEYQPELVNYALWRVSLREGAHSLERGIGYLRRYLEAMKALGDYVRARSRAARYDVEPFELQLSDRRNTRK